MPFIIKRNTLVLFVVCTLFTCCNFKKNKLLAQEKGNSNLSEVKSAINDVSKEKFETFFLKFAADSSFQSLRIEFPLKLTIVDDDDVDSTRLIAKSEWRYVDLVNGKPNNKIIKKIKINSGEVKIQYMIEDTGILSEFFFVNKNGQWWLNLVKDESD